MSQLCKSFLWSITAQIRVSPASADLQHPRDYGTIINWDWKVRFLISDDCCVQVELRTTWLKHRNLEAQGYARYDEQILAEAGLQVPGQQGPDPAAHPCKPSTQEAAPKRLWIKSQPANKILHPLFSPKLNSSMNDGSSRKLITIYFEKHCTFLTIQAIKPCNWEQRVSHNKEMGTCK